MTGRRGVGSSGEAHPARAEAASKTASAAGAHARQFGSALAATSRPLLPHLALGALAAAAVAFPLGMFYLRYPNEFVAPLSRFSILGDWMEKEVVIAGQPVANIVLRQLSLGFQAYTATPLRHWYTPDVPILRDLPAAFFLLGAALMLLRLRDERVWLVALWLVAFGVAGGLSESTPAAQRYIFVAPAVAVLVALPLAEVAARFPQATRRGRALLALGLGAVLLIAAAFDLQFYFGDYTLSRRFSDTNTEVAHNLGMLLKDSGLEDQGVHVYFFGQPRMGWESIRTLSYLAPKASFTDVLEPLAAAPYWDVALPSAFVFLPETLADLEWVRQAYPQGEVMDRDSATGGRLYTLFLVR